MANEIQPYVGPRPFERGDENRFYGREGEASELLSYVIAHPAVLLYSQSGAGKTSLLNARLIPFLEEEGFEILPTARVRGLVPQGMQQDAISNIYVFNVLMSWAEGLKEDAPDERTTLKEFLQRRFHPDGKEDTHTPFVAIFDQFEELFTFYPERWGDRQDFFDQVADALEADRLMRVVFVMREDFIAELDPYVSVLPEKLRTRFRLERLRAEDALNAAREPLHGTGYSFAEGVAEQLVQNLLNVPVEIAAGITTVTGEFVEPVQLQVVCQTLWEKLRLTNEKVITQTALETFGNVDQALSGFYETAIAKTAKRADVKEGLLRRLFEETLITPSGTRGTVFGGGQDIGGVPPTAIRHLVNEHLLRAERRGGSIWYELTHDRLIEPIKTANQRWRLARTGTEQTQHRLERRAAEWVRNGRADDYLLDEAELLEAQRWLESSDAEEVGYSEALFALVQASRAASQEKQAKSAKRLRRLAAALAVMFLLAVGTAVYAVNQTRLAWLKEQEATDALSTARQQKALANKQADFAQEQKQQAEAAREEAVAAREDAEEQKALAEQSAQKAEAAKKEAEKQARLAAISEREAKAKTAEISRLRKLENERQEAEKSEMSAITLDDNGKYDEALEAYSKVLSTYQKINHSVGITDIQYRIRALDGKRYDKQGESQKAKEAYEEALQLRRDKERQEDQNLIFILKRLAALYEDEGDDEKAESLYLQALKVNESLELKAPDFDSIHISLARLYMRQQKYVEAEPRFRQVLNIMKERTKLAEDPNRLPILTGLAQTSWKLRNYTEAESFFRQVLTINRNSYYIAENSYISSLGNLAKLYRDGGMPDRVDQYLNEAHEMIDAAMFYSLTEYGLFYSQQNMYQEAQEKYKQALELIDEPLKEQDSEGVIKMLEDYSALLRKTNQEKLAQETEALAQKVRAEYPRGGRKN